MAHFFFTRRSFNAAKGSFGDDVAPTTHYVMEHEGWNAVTPVDQATWLQRLKPQVGSHGVAIFVHGFNTPITRMFWSLRKLKAGLKAHGFNGDVVGFAWPTGQGGPLKKYVEDHGRVHQTARSIYTDGAEPLRNFISNRPVHVICHSMGAYALKTCLNGLGGIPFDRICAFAGDVRRDGFFAPNGTGALFEPWSRHFTNYYNAEDFPLGLASKVYPKRRGSRMGKLGLPHPTDAGFTDVDCTSRYWDFINSGGSLDHASHRFYFADQSFLRDLSLTLQGIASDKRGAAPSPPDHALLP